MSYGTRWHKNIPSDVTWIQIKLQMEKSHLLENTDEGVLDILNIYNQLTSYSNDNINDRLWIFPKKANIPAVKLNRRRRNYKIEFNNLHAVNEKKKKKGYISNYVIHSLYSGIYDLLTTDVQGEWGIDIVEWSAWLWSPECWNAQLAFWDFQGRDKEIDIISWAQSSLPICQNAQLTNYNCQTRIRNRHGIMCIITDINMPNTQLTSYGVVEWMWNHQHDHSQQYARMYNSPSVIARVESRVGMESSAES